MGRKAAGLPARKLTAAQTAEIAADTQHSHRELAIHYGVSDIWVSKIRQRRLEAAS